MKIQIPVPEWAFEGSQEATLTDAERSEWTRRLSSLVDIDSDGCWLIRTSVDRNGYARWHGPRWDIAGWAHRNVWFIFNGPIPWHLEVDHLCYRQTCVNPQHLELVTPMENKRRGAERRRAFRDAAGIQHGTRGWADGCGCRTCYRSRPFPLADQTSRVDVKRLPVAPGVAVDTVPDLPLAPAWMEGALCAEHPDDLWTRDRLGSRKVAEARKVCERCPVLDDCFAYAVEMQPAHGVWAGLSATDFRAPVLREQVTA